MADASPERLISARENRLPVHYLVRGPAYDLDLSFPHAVSDDMIARLAAAFAIVSIGATAAFLLRGRQLPTVAPSLVFAAIGLTWWLLFVPSVVGLLALLAACWTAMRTRQRPAFR